MSSENASSGTVQMKIEMILGKGKVKIKERDGFSVDLKSPVLKVSELYNAVFTDITQPTNIIVTASNDVLQSREAKPIFENIKTIVDNAIEEINSGLIELAESENNQDDDENEEPIGDEVNDPLAEFRANPGSLLSDENNDGA